jgi:hypothetical protein
VKQIQFFVCATNKVQYFPIIIADPKFGVKQLCLFPQDLNFNYLDSLANKSHPFVKKMIISPGLDSTNQCFKPIISL